MNNITRYISDNHIGIRTTDYYEIIPPLYKRVVILRPGVYLALNDDNKWGILNDKNQVVISFEFDKIEPLEFGNYYVAKKNDSLSLFSLSGQLLFEEECDELESLGHGHDLFLFAKKSLYGVVDKNGQIILPCNFESISLVCHGRFLIASCRGQVKCFNRGGDEIRLKARSDFEICKNHVDGYLRTTEKGLSGLAYAVDEGFCIEIIPCQYHSICEKDLGTDHEPVITLKRDFGFKDKYLLVSTMSNGSLLYGFIDWENKIRIPLVYEDAEAFDSLSYFRSLDFTSVKLNDKWGIIDRQGKWLTLPRWDSVEVINRHGLCIVRQNNKYGVYKFTGEEVLSCSYNAGCMIKDFLPVRHIQLDEKLSGAFLFGIDGKVGLYSKRGKTLIEPNYSDIQYAGEGICAVCRDSKWGYYDLMNGEIVPCQYEHVEVFSSGISCMHSSYNHTLWKWKYLVECFGYRHEKSAVVDRDGSIRLHADRIIRIAEHMFWLEKDNYGKIVNTQGETLYEYPAPIPEENGQFSLVVESGRCFISDSSGLWTVDILGNCVIGARLLLDIKGGLPVLLFNNGVAELMVNGKAQNVYVDMDGNIVPNDLVGIHISQV